VTFPLNSETVQAVISREALAADRWALFAELRARNPVHWSGELNSWFIVRHADVLSALQSPQLVAAHPLRSSRQIFGRTALDADGTAHRDLRRMVTWFSQADMAGYHRLIDRVIDRVVDDVDPAGEIDLVRSVAERIPARVIAAILGMPDDDGEKYYHQLRPVFAHIDDPRQSLMAALDSCDGAAEMMASTVFSDDGVVAALASGHRQRAVPSPPEVRRQVLLLLAAGTRTTTAAIANTLATVAADPASYERLGEAPWRARVVAESLRWRPPLHFTLRFTTSDYQVAGRILPAGAPVQLALAAANRDEGVFERADRWLPARDCDRSLVFGGGRHVCAGSLLATAEIERLLAQVHRRFSSLTSAEPPADEGLTFVMPGRLRARVTTR
jgi:cytochrome P450